MPNNDEVKVTTNLVKLISFVIACIVLVGSIVGFGIKYGELTTKFNILSERVLTLEGERPTLTKDITEIKLTVREIKTKVDMLEKK